MSSIYDICVLGAGHAGCEAALAAARAGYTILLLSLDTSTAAKMSCNPAIGGQAKGQLVREIDALGGEMASAADKSGIQFRMLNRSKGPAVWSPRSQNDRVLYSDEMTKVLKSTENLTYAAGEAVEIQISGKDVTGIVLKSGKTISTRIAIVTCGTFLAGKIFRGEESQEAGRIDEPPAVGLTESLNRLGIRSARFKTGTPPRIDGKSIDFSKFEVQEGDKDIQPFSFRTKSIPLEQRPCFLGYTSEITHDILRKGFDTSPMFSGKISGIGPRYCPSIEDKINRFADKNRHQLFLEPEGLNTDLYYLNGFSTSLSKEIQLEALRTIPGFENIEVPLFGYAIEYDYFPPDQIKFSLESKLVNGLFFAGQVNGTSGYEEAAAQGLMAGLNAIRLLSKEEPFVLRRDEAYIGVLIDDIITKPIDEPYRMFTSRAESRLLLRQDNADERLMHYGVKFGLIENDLFLRMKQKVAAREEAIVYFKKTRISPDDASGLLKKRNTAEIKEAETLYKLLKRPELKLDDILLLASDFPVSETELNSSDFLAQLEMEVKYEGYIERLRRDSERVARMENTVLPRDMDYMLLVFLSIEAREKLTSQKPGTLGQASRIAGISPSDIANLMIHLKKKGVV